MLKGKPFNRQHYDRGQLNLFIFFTKFVRMVCDKCPKWHLSWKSHVYSSSVVYCIKYLMSTVYQKNDGTQALWLDSSEKSNHCQIPPLNNKVVL